MFRVVPLFVGGGAGGGDGADAEQLLAALLGAFAAPASPRPMRVRAVLDRCSAAQKATLKSLLPAGALAACPDVPTAPYPSALLKMLPCEGGSQYAWLGIVAEELLRRPASEIRPSALSGLLMRMYHGKRPFAETHAATVALFKSPTTQPFLDCVAETRRGVEAVLRGDLLFDQAVRSSGGLVEGHPDARTATQIFEVKLTGQLRENWPAFLLQVFAYVALAAEVEDAYVVLPLQRSVVHFDVRAWSAAARKEYAGLLERVASPAGPSAAALSFAGAERVSSAAQGIGPHSRSMAAALCDAHLIGCHMPKRKSLRETILNLRDYSKPYQIFLGPPQSSKLAIADADLAAGAAAIAETGARVFVHSPYMINLATDTTGEGAWNTELLRKNLKYAAAIGCGGVVVHVGKSVKRSTAAALATMRTNILACLEEATPACPLLLETPAGQGTELLTDADAFIGFVQEIADPRLKICVDTCHTFACGQDPLTYIKKVPAEKLALIHFNDSKEACGSRKDRHAFIGEGQIGYEKMEAIAHHCSGCKLPMVVE
jgi:deoxyribonuclease-4